MLFYPHFSLCIIQESYQGRTCESYLSPSFLLILQPGVDVMRCHKKSKEEGKVESSTSHMSHCTALAASTHWRRHFLSQSSHPISHMCLFATGLTNSFGDPIHTFGLSNILWWRVPQFRHALCREGLPPLCFKPTDWCSHWMSQTVRSQWTVIPWLSSLYHLVFKKKNFLKLSQPSEFHPILNTIYLYHRITLKSLSSIKQKLLHTFISALFT